MIQPQASRPDQMKALPAQPAWRVLGLCGSLRRASRSMALLEATKILAGANLEFSIFEGLGRLPLFNPDLEPDAPQVVSALWEAVTKTDILVISSPEYAHGVTGTIKNALDWLVGHGPFADKPVMVFNPSPRAIHADEALRETLRTMSARLVPPQGVRIPVPKLGVDAREILRDPDCSSQILSALRLLESWLASGRHDV